MAKEIRVILTQSEYDKLWGAKKALGLTWRGLLLKSVENKPSWKKMLIKALEDEKN